MGEINTKLRAARTKKRWTLERAAEKVGVDLQTYYRWERGKQQIRLSSLDMLCEAFGMTPEELGFEQMRHLPLFEEDGQGSEQNRTLEVLQREETDAPSGDSDGGLWLGTRVTAILLMVMKWHAVTQCSDLQQIVDQEVRMFEMVKKEMGEQAFLLSRRQALIMIAALPTTFLAGLRSGTTEISGVVEEFLPASAASMSACWHLLTGSEITAVKETISRVLPPLLTLAQSASKYQRSAASLAAQGCLLSGLVVHHQLPPPQNARERLACCKQAVEYAKLSGEQSLLVASLIHLGGAQGDLGQLEAMLQTHQQAMQHVTTLSPFLQSKLYAETGYAYAKNGQAQEALNSISQAHGLFPGEASKEEPVYLSTDYGTFSLALFRGQTLLEVGLHDKYRTQALEHYGQAQNILAQVINGKGIMPERFRVEIVNRQSLAALRAGNLELFRAGLIDGLAGAKGLQSEQRRQEAIANWKEARAIWPQETRVLELADLLLK